jgi:hypothetical protein
LLTTIFYHADNFCNEINKNTLQDTPMRWRPGSMNRSEILTIYIFFHCSKFRTFKDYYKTYIQGYYRNAFSKLVSYNRFVELIQENMAYLGMFAISLNSIAKGVAFIDSTLLAVCHNRRIHFHKVLKGIAQRGKSSMG